MKAKISELEIKKDFKIRKGSIVSLDFWGDSSPIETQVFDIFSENGEIFIESMTVSFGSPMTHSAEQYKESGKLIKY